MIEKVIMELSPSGKAVVINVDGLKYYTSKKFVSKLILGEIKKLKLKKDRLFDVMSRELR